MIGLKEFIAIQMQGSDVAIIIEQRGKIADKTASLGAVIVEHLIKALRWDDPTNYTKHIRDMDNWLEQIGSKQYNGNKKLRAKDYLRYMSMTLGDEKGLKNRIDKSSKFKKYRHLNLKNYNVKEIHFVIEKFLIFASKKLTTKDDYFDIATQYFINNER